MNGSKRCNPIQIVAPGIATKAIRGSCPRTWERASGSGIQLSDFWAYMPMHNYIYAPTRALWPAGSINSRIPPVKSGANDEIEASSWIDKNRPVEQMTWVPGLPESSRTGYSTKAGGSTGPAFAASTNTSRRQSFQAMRIAPIVGLPICGSSIPTTPNTSLAGSRIASSGRTRRSIMLSCSAAAPVSARIPLLEPVKHAIGPWNFQEALPAQVLGRFNGFLKSVILRINEAHDLGEFDRFRSTIA
jgi:hypothetical protein